MLCDKIPKVRTLPTFQLRIYNRNEKKGMKKSEKRKQLPTVVILGDHSICHQEEIEILLFYFNLVVRKRVANSKTPKRRYRNDQKLIPKR